MVAMLVALTTMLASIVVAHRHASLGRGDRRGAGRLAVVAFVMIVAGWAVAGPHVAHPREFLLLVNAVSFAAFLSGLVWALYMAVEPYVRRHWPDALISWTRILAGQVRNPLVASHVLAGVCLELTFFAGLGVVFSRLQSVPGVPVFIASLQGGAVPLGAVFDLAVNALVYAIGFVLIIVLLRLLLRRLWIADALGSVLIGAVLNTDTTSVESESIVRIYFVLNAWALLWLLRRFGLLSMLAAILMEFILVSQAPYVAWDSWYRSWSLLPGVLVVSVAVWALWVILSAQRSPSTDSATS
jgi:serine/threonine-protein kinase